MIEAQQTQKQRIEISDSKQDCSILLSRRFEISMYLHLQVWMLNVKCLPRVFGMIGGGETNRNAAILRNKDMLNQQSALFRMLKCIPELCNVSSRDLSHVDEPEASKSSKRRKVKK